LFKLLEAASDTKFEKFHEDRHELIQVMLAHMNYYRGKSAVQPVNDDSIKSKEYFQEELLETTYQLQNLKILTMLEKKFPQSNMKLSDEKKVKREIRKIEDIDDKTVLNLARRFIILKEAEEKSKTLSEEKLREDILQNYSNIYSEEVITELLDRLKISEKEIPAENKIKQLEERIEEINQKINAANLSINVMKNANKSNNNYRTIGEYSIKNYWYKKKVKTKKKSSCDEKI
jgi:hypothetical protein